MNTTDGKPSLKVVPLNVGPDADAETRKQSMIKQLKFVISRIEKGEITCLIYAGILEKDRFTWGQTHGTWAEYIVLASKLHHVIMKEWDDAAGLANSVWDDDNGDDDAPTTPEGDNE